MLEIEIFGGSCFLFYIFISVLQVDGFFFNGDRLQEGAAQLKRLRDDRALCRQMGERGRAKVQGVACMYLVCVCVCIY